MSSNTGLKLTKPGVALITGASSGVGRASAVGLSNAGWTCVVAARRQEELNETLSLMGEKRNKESIAIAADLSKREEVQRVFAVIKQKFGRLDLLFNNAGKSGPRVALEDLTTETFESIMTINVFTPFWCTQEAFRLMKSQSPRGGRIINNGSISAHTPRPMSTPYTTSKHAVLGMTKATALDGREFGIAVSQLDIGNAEAFEGKFKNMPQADGSLRDEPAMHVDYTAHAIVYMAGLPLEINNLNHTLMATAMPFVGRG
ncbi:hypothetical protein P7C73_g631, partial [Tremellales sp. Uapishka_1]